ncbi:MAG TPA: fibronectin type III domain-containing protein [Edaphocola sp.]|nr:fibronectin type III domain-containing protein [Edaphocola sp.]
MNTKTFFNWRKAGVTGLLAAGMALFSLGSSYGQCTTITTLPWAEDFSSGSIPSSCWTNESSSTSSNALWKFSGTPGYGAQNNGKTSGTFAWVDASSPYTGIHDVALITPSINVSSLTTPYLRFEWFKNNQDPVNYGNNQLSVEVSSNGGTTWTSVFSDTTNDPNWRWVGISLASFANSTIQIKFVVDKDLTGNGYFYDDLLLDNITVMEAPTCFAPLTFSNSNITSSTATETWNKPSVVPGNGYQYYYNTSGTTPTASTAALGSSTDTFANLTGLSPNTLYYFWTRSVCSSTDTSEWSLNHDEFTTPCNPFAVPYFEGFETGYTNATEVGGCISQEMISNQEWKAYNNATSYNRTPRTGNWDAALRYGSESWMFIPINLTGGTPYRLKFYARQDGATATDASIDAAYGTAPNSTAMTNSLIASTGLVNGGYQQFLVDFVPGTTGTYYVGIHGDINGSPWYITLDDISIETSPSCIEPATLASSNVTPTAATVNWNVPAVVPGNGYAYYYNTTGVAPTASTTASGSATTNSANLSSLTQNTLYYFWVRSMCSATDTSDWSTVLTFRTPQMPATLPYADNFTSTGGNWTMLGDNQINQWAAGSATGNTGNSMYISNDGGVSNAYSTGSISVSQTYRDIVLPAGANPFDLFFDWKMKGEGAVPNTQWDYFRVWLVPNTFEPTAGTQISAFSSNGQQFGNNFNDPNGTGSWHTEHYIIPNTYAGDTVRLVFEWRNDGSGGTQPPAAIDNVNVSIITCITPDSLKADNITTTTADINWATPAITPGTGYDYYYNTTGTAPTAGTIVSGSSTDTFASLTNLTQNTTYYVWVRSVCSSSDKSYWSPIPTVFTTECNTADVPYTVPMATATAPGLPDCMSEQALNPNDNEGWYVSSGYPGSSYGFSGDYLESDYTGYYDGPVDNWVYTNKINMNAGTYYKLSFKYGNNSSSNTEKLAVAYGRAANADSMSAPVFDDTTIQFAGAVDTNVYFMVPTSGAYYIGFHAHSDADQYYLFLSNIVVDSLPTCQVANSLIANNITTNSANVAWFGTALEYRVEYGESGFTLGSGTQVSSTSGTYQLTGLNPNTTYNFYVRDVCVPGIDSADWSAAGMFTTLCDTPAVSLGHDTAFCTGGTIILHTGNSDTGRTVLWNDGSSADSLVVNATGTYYVTVTNQFGCSATDTAHINVKTYPVIDLGNDTTICSGNVLTLNAGTQPFGTTFYWSTTQTTQTIQVSDSGKYKVTANNHGCISSDSIQVSEIAAPHLSGITITQNTDGSYSCSASGVQNATGYHWDFGDGSASSTSVSPTHTYTNTGNYTVTLVVSNACGSDSASANVRFIAAGIHQVSLDKDQLKLYPNPARDRVTLKNESPYKMASVSVYNILGQEVFQDNTNNQSEYELDVQGFAPGMYNIKITFTDGNWVSRKFEIRK